ncbi:hypothetical protein [Brevibacillus migulae]|uniref:hypothetical protein n=1 Tax=Brevibacillus migulae TaxID=1644114 RepID=UPI00106DFEC1|nr:hypothetical protein [Brevibacillus migulae]
MKKFLTDPLTSIAESVMELADSFGLLAIFYAKHSTETSYLWQSGAFIRRQTKNQHEILLHLIFPDGRMGQAFTSDCSQQGVELAFHQARHAADLKSGHLDLIHYLDISEKKVPHAQISLEAPDYDPNQLARHIEKHHYELLPQFQPDLLDTSFHFFQENAYSLRSDGTQYKTNLCKASCRHEIFSFEQFTSFPFQQDWVLSPHYAFDSDLEQLGHQMRRWKTMRGRSLPPKHETFPAIDKIPLLFDAAIVAGLMNAWLDSHDHPSIRCSAATLRFEPGAVADSLPHHPYGYLLPPATLLSPGDRNSELLEALREYPPFFGHYDCQLPFHQDQVHSPCAIFAALTSKGLYQQDRLRVCEGISQLYTEEKTNRFHLLPASMYETDLDSCKPVAPVWITGDALPLFSCLLAGFGPKQTIWPLSEKTRSFSLPAYLFYHPFERSHAS